MNNYIFFIYIFVYHSVEQTYLYTKSQQLLDLHLIIENLSITIKCNISSYRLIITLKNML